MRRALIAMCLVGSSASGAAQETASEQLGGPWYSDWSPLRPIADLPRTLPAASPLPDLAGTPAPRIGMWWSGGNPGSAAVELDHGRSQFRISRSDTHGSLRRRFDPEDVQATELEALGWRSFGTSSAAIGRVLVAERTFGDASPTAYVNPFTSNPFIVADTTTPSVRRLGARLEGALAHAIDGWSFGLAAGYEGYDTRTTLSRVPRLSRFSVPAIAGGLARRAFGTVTIGGHARWMGGNETITIVPEPGGTVAYQASGFAEPDEISVPGPTLYQRWIERRASAVGVSGSGITFGTTWVVLAERTDRHDRQFSRRDVDAPIDSWEADGYAMLGAAQRRLGERLTLTALARYETLDGAAERGDLDGDIYRAQENALRLRADVRYGTREGGWTIALSATADREERVRRDFLDQRAASVTGWTGGAALEIARALDTRTMLSVGGGISQYASTALIPDPTTLGPVTRWLSGPELALSATQLRPAIFGARLRRDLGRWTSLLLGGSYRALSPVGEPTVPATPEGERSSWSASLGVILGGAGVRSEEPGQ